MLVLLFRILNQFFCWQLTDQFQTSELLITPLNFSYHININSYNFRFHYKEDLVTSRYRLSKTPDYLSRLIHRRGGKIYISYSNVKDLNSFSVADRSPLGCSIKRISHGLDRCESVSCRSHKAGYYRSNVSPSTLFLLFFHFFLSRKKLHHAYN